MFCFLNPFNRQAVGHESLFTLPLDQTDRPDVRPPTTVALPCRKNATGLVLELQTKGVCRPPPLDSTGANPSCRSTSRPRPPGPTARRHAQDTAIAVTGSHFLAYYRALPRTRRGPRMESVCSSRNLEINCNRAADVGNRISKTQIVKKTTLAKLRGNIKGSCTYKCAKRRYIYIYYQR